jgi:hypothetical protein
MKVNSHILMGALLWVGTINAAHLWLNVIRPMGEKSV